MSSESLDLDHAEAIALLQPFVDGELGDAERELVARQIAENPEYQAFVREQQQVRAALQSLVLEAAPQALRERVLADLDAAEREQSRGQAGGWLAPVVGRIKSFGRGAMLMVPAAAAAAVLFVVASNSSWLGSGAQVDGVHVDGNMATSLPRARAKPAADAPAPTESAKLAVAPEPEPAPEADASLPGAGAFADNTGFAVQVAPSRSLPRDVALVSDAARAPGPVATATVRYQVGDGAVVVDRQRRAGSEAFGAGQVFRGHAYHLTRDTLGRPSVAFRVAGVHHDLALEGADARTGAGVDVQEADFQMLLLVADAIRQAHG